MLDRPLSDLGVLETYGENLQNDIATAMQRIKKPKKAVVTAGMPYANGPLHIGHLAGAHVPADIYSRWLKLLIGRENVLFVCGTDDHGSNSEVAAKTKNLKTEDFIDEIHTQQKKTLVLIAFCGSSWNQFS